MKEGRRKGGVKEGGREGGVIDERVTHREESGSHKQATQPNPKQSKAKRVCK